MPTGLELRRFYSEVYYKEYKGVTVPKPKHVYRAGKYALQRMQFLLSVIGEPAGKLLDIGAGGGEFVYYSGQIGFPVAKGIEPNVGYCTYARNELGVDLAQAELNELTETFDVITMFHVLEHLVNPLAVFQRLHGLLNPAGVLFVEVPWIESNSQSPSNIYFKAHTLYFGKATLKACASGHFDLVKTDTSTGNLRMIFKRKDNTAPVELPQRAEVDALMQRVFSKGWMEYLFKGRGIFRPFQILQQTLDEMKIRALPRKAILDQLLEQKGSGQ